MLHKKEIQQRLQLITSFTVNKTGLRQSAANELMGNCLLEGARTSQFVLAFLMEGSPRCLLKRF